MAGPGADGRRRLHHCFLRLSEQCSIRDQRFRRVPGHAGRVPPADRSALQVDASGQALIGLRTTDLSLPVHADAEVAYLVSERWLASATLSHDLARRRSNLRATGADHAYWTYGLSVGFYLQDRLLLSATAFDTQDWTRGSRSVSHRFNRNGGVDLSVTYRVAGRFSAPGYFTGPGERGGT